MTYIWRTTMDSPDDPTPPAAPGLPTPQLERSTKIALVVLAAVLVFCVLAIWLPSPAGWIAALLFLYVGGTSTVLIVSDFGKLRQDRLFTRRASLLEPTPDDPDVRVVLDIKALTVDQLRPWRAWRKWFGLIAIAAIVIYLVAPDASVRIVAGVLLALGWLRDLQLATRVLDTLPKSVWSGLSKLERGWLRAHAVLIGVVMISIWLGVVAIVAYMFSGHIPVRWNTFAFALLYGWMALAAMKAGRRWIAMAFRAQPGHETETIEIERVVASIDSPDRGDE